MITAGIDLAAQPERTAVVRIRWIPGRAVIEDVVSRADDEVILQMVKRTRKTGIDCPFGWPAAFVDFVTSHHAGQVSIPTDGHGSRRDLTMRRTDLFVYEQLRLTPLSVSADRIAHVALRCAVLLAKIEATGVLVDRSGSGPVAEVYPAASLRRWGLDHRGYKQKTGTGALAGLVDHLPDEAPWLDCTTHEQAMRRSHDVFDAVIAAMTVRASGWDRRSRQQETTWPLPQLKAGSPSPASRSAHYGKQALHAQRGRSGTDLAPTPSAPVNKYMVPRGLHPGTGPDLRRSCCRLS